MTGDKVLKLSKLLNWNHHVTTSACEKGTPNKALWGVKNIHCEKMGLVLQLACFGVEGTEAEKTLSSRVCGGALRRTRCVELLACSRKKMVAKIKYSLTWMFKKKKNTRHAFEAKPKRNAFSFITVSRDYLYTVLTVEGKSAWSLTTKLSVSCWILVLSAVWYGKKHADRNIIINETRGLKASWDYFQRQRRTT